MTVGTARHIVPPQARDYSERSNRGVPTDLARRPQNDRRPRSSGAFKVGDTGLELAPGCAVG